MKLFNFKDILPKGERGKILSPLPSVEVHRCMRNPIIIALLCLLVSLEGWSQQARLGKILGLSVTGNTTSDASVLRMSSGLREGQELAFDEVQKSIRQLWALGLFSDIRVLFDRRTAEGVYMTIVVKEYPRLDRVVLEGNKKIKSEDLEKEVGFFRGQVLSPSQITGAKKRLLKMYADKGYTLAAIDSRQYDSTEKEGRSVLHLTISEGKKVQIKKINFFGNVAFDDGKLRKQLKETKEDRWYRGADFDMTKFEEDKGKVLEFYANNGYRDAEIIRDSLYYNEAKEDMFIDLWVREGMQYKVGNITWEGNVLFPEKHLVSLLELNTGDVFSQEKFTKSIHEKIGGAYYDLGYIYAGIQPVENLRGEDTLDIHFMINEGEPVRIRDIRISGNSRTKERVIRRELLIRPGMIFSKELLMRSHRELMVLNYFANVTPDVVPVDEKNLDLTFKMEEKSTDTANLSAGWSELDRLIGSVGLGMTNLFGNGQQLGLDWNFGRFYRAFNLSFTEPWFLSTPTLIGVSLYDTKREPYYIGYKQESRGFSFRLGRRFIWPDNYFRGDWIYRLDETNLSDFSSYYKELNPNNIVFEQWPLTSSGITQILSRNSLNHAEFPTAGSSVSLSTELAGGFFGGNVGYHKHIFSVEYFFPSIFDKLIILSRAKVGFMGRLGTTGRIPYLEYFFMGGSGLSRAEPLRGYEDPLAGGYYYSEGGRVMMKTTFELRFPVITNPMAFGLLFMEAGNTWLDLGHTDPFDLRRSVGIGARIFMPMVGMLGFDYAYGFDNIDTATGEKRGAWKPHFVFGRGF